MDRLPDADGNSGPSVGATDSGCARAPGVGGTDGAQILGAADTPVRRAAVDRTCADRTVDELTHDPLRFSQWMKRSATGAVLSGIALGLQQALEQKREIPAFVMEAPDQPDDPHAQIILHFDPDDPTKCVAVVRSQTPGPLSPD